MKSKLLLLALFSVGILGCQDNTGTSDESSMPPQKEVANFAQIMGL